MANFRGIFLKFSIIILQEIYFFSPKFRHYASFSILAAAFDTINIGISLIVL